MGCRETMVQHFYHCVQLLPHWHHTTKMIFKRSPRVFGSFLPEGEGDECSSSGSKCPAATCMLSNIPPTPAEHTCRVASICWHPKMLPQATSPGHRNLAVIFTQQLPAAASTKRQPRHRDCGQARLCSWEWILHCLGQKLPGLARVFSSYQDVYP